MYSTDATGLRWAIIMVPPKTATTAETTNMIRSRLIGGSQVLHRLYANGG